MKIHPLFETMLRRLPWPLFIPGDNPWHDWEVAGMPVVEEEGPSPPSGNRNEYWTCYYHRTPAAIKRCNWCDAIAGVGAVSMFDHADALAAKDARIKGLEARLEAAHSGHHCGGCCVLCGKADHRDVRNAALEEAANIAQGSGFSDFGIDIRLGHIAEMIRERKR